MNQVALAAQTISRSTAISWKFLRKIGVPGFQSTKASEKFFLLCDELFDFLNSRQISGHGAKAPLTLARLGRLRELISEAEDVLLHLCDMEGRVMSQSRRHIGMTGLVCAAKSLLSIAEELLNDPSSGFNYLLAYRMSQDHLELFFNAVRRAGTRKYILTFV